MPAAIEPKVAPDAELGALLCEIGLIDDASPRVEPAGDGNINWVRRIRSRHSGRTVIAKLARPALERFPEYETSTERIVFEHRYYEVARPHDPDGVCPRVLYFDPERRLLILEDLADAERLDRALDRAANVSGALATLTAFLGRVHRATASDPALTARFQNSGIQRLHGDHIFKLPYERTDFSLAPEVQAQREAWIDEGSLGRIASHAYKRYLEPHGALVHADVQPGNVLLTAKGPVLLDAEIAHVGDPAFDLGTLLGHIWLPAAVRGGPETLVPETAEIWKHYQETRAAPAATHFSDVARYAGLEMMRRTIGAARVPAVASPQASLAVMEAANRIIRNPPARPEEVSLA